jgi:predicted nucleotidyltransferase
MTTIIETYRAEIERLCRTYRVRRLDVFGSAIQARGCGMTPGCS